MNKLTEAESRLVVARGCKWGGWGFNGYGVFFWDNEDILGLDSGGGFTIFNAIEFTLLNG